MAEHDYVIANNTGSQVRADINNALSAIVSNNSKATAPSTTFAYQFWADTGTGILKQRNAANNAWISILTLATGVPIEMPSANLTGALPAISGASLTNLPGSALDSPAITGTLSVLSGGNVTHTVANWSDDVSYTITPTNCTVGAVNSSGQFVITHTSGLPSYTIKATTASLGLDDSALVTKNITMTLTAPSLSSPADVGTSENVVYTITSTDSNDDKLILNMGSSNFTYQSVSVGTASKVGNTIECIGFTTNNPAVTIQFTAEATYSVTATAVKIDGTYGTSASSSADSITIQNFTAMVGTGGTITTVGNYKVHTFLSSGTFEVTTVGSLYTTLDYLVVGGGGTSGFGGTSSAGGGGAAGYRSSWNSETSGGGGSSETGLTASATTYTVTIGAGGAAKNVNGNDSVFGSITSLGGGAGATDTVAIGHTGGCGGGSEARYPAGTWSGGLGTANQGYNGGGGGNNPVGYQYNTGGGGGAGAVGTTAIDGGNQAPGGAGQYSTISGSSTAYAGGGGGWNYPAAVASAGGVGGGGTGGYTNTYWGTAGTVNTGGGGGAGTAGSGGSGIVIIAYRFQQ
jgi:hypothetical protein